LRLLPYYARNLGAEAQRIFVERPAVAWEYQLFAAVFADEIALHASLLRDYQRGTTWGARTTIEDAGRLAEWLHKAAAEGGTFAGNVERILDAATEAFGPDGQPGDAEAIIDSAKKLGDVHRRAIEWVLDLRRCESSNPLYRRALQLAERLLEDTIRQVREFSHTFSTSLAATLEAVRNGDKGPHSVTLTLRLTVPDGLNDELKSTLDEITAEIAATGLASAE
jgi:hypothetical protein